MLYHSLSLFVIVTNLAVAEINDYQDAAYEAWEADHYKVYATKGEPLGPEKTLVLLQNLHNAYQGKLGTADRLAKVDNLLSINKIDTTKCTPHYFGGLNKIIEYESVYTINVIPYIKHFKSKLFLLCKEQFERNISAHLSNIDRANIRALHDEVFNANNRLDMVEQYFYIPRVAIQRGSLNYFVQKSTQDLTIFTANKQGKKLFSREIIRLIGTPCGQVTKWSKEGLETLNILKYDKDLMRQLKPETLERLVDAEICAEIDKLSLEVLSKYIYDDLKVRFLPPHEHLGKKLLDCFRSPHTKD